MTRPITPQIRIVATCALVAMLAFGLSGCIDTTRMASPKVVPPQEASLEHPAGTALPATPVEIMDEANLVHNVVFHRAMYARYLDVLASFYGERGHPEKASWARTELKGLRRVKTYRYLADAEAPTVSLRPDRTRPRAAVVLTAWSPESGDTPPKAGPDEAPPAELPGSLENPGGIDLPDIPVANMGEADLVENLVMHRTMYTQFLTALTTYYSERGYAEKASWAQTELNGLRRVKTYRYIMDAEVPRADLRPMDSIAEADQLYEEGMRLLRKGGRGIPCFYNQSTMRLALAKFRELVDKYPTSDKIDDAAYYIAEIYKEYEKEQDNGLAIAWYKRAIQWDANTPHPCRFRIATTYDYRLHDREQALFWYQKTLEEESKFASLGGDFTLNVKFAQGRIRELTPEEHLRSPAEAIPDGRPAPSAAPEPVPSPDTGEPVPSR